MLYSLRAKIRYLIGLRRFLKQPITPSQARELVVQSLARREENFLRLVELGIYGKPDSPYRKLLLNVSIDMDALRGMVQKDGLDETLARLYDAGVYITYDEMRGRQPVRRGDLEFMIDEAALDNPLLQQDYEMGSTGSSGTAGSRAFTDLSLLAYEAASFSIHFQAHDVLPYQMAFFGPVPPALLGLSGCLRFIKLGGKAVGWFTPVRFSWDIRGLSGRLLVLYSLIIARLAGHRLPWPQYVPAEDSVIIARWLDEMRRRGQPILLQITASAATRVCLAARDNGLDISGSAFRVGGEPFTPAKAATVAAAGVKAFNGYAATELGNAGLGCAAPGATVDDLHVVTDKFFVSTRDKMLDASGATVPVLVFTTLHPNCRKILLNAESGDYGHLVERECGCLLGELGLKTHLTGLHGYDKMTSEGVTFMGSDLFKLVEEVLPAHFGGDPTQYQLAEEEGEDGFSRVSIVISPRVGQVDDAAVIGVVINALGAYEPDRGPGMAERWRQSGTLRVVRREPFSAGGRKVLPLQILSGQGHRSGGE